MARKSKNTDVVAASPLVATGVEKMILVIRDKQVLLDRDLAALYGVETRRINEQMKRNIERFPEDLPNWERTAFPIELVKKNNSVNQIKENYCEEKSRERERT